MFLSDYGYMGPELIWMQIVGRVITKESINFKLKYWWNEKIEKTEKINYAKQEFFHSHLFQRTMEHWKFFKIWFQQ